MPYIGNPPAEKYASYDVQHITTSATSSYVLDKNVANENEIRVVLNNIIQQPGSSYAYTASGNTLTLSAATTSSDKLYVVFTGKAVQTVTPPPSSVGLAQFNATGSPGTNTFLRGDNSWATPSDTSLTLNNNGANKIIAGTATTNTMSGQTNLIYNGTILGVGADGANADLGTGVHIKSGDSGQGSVEAEANLLILESASGGGLSIYTGNSHEAKINFGDSGNDNQGQIMYHHNGDSMRFNTNNDERMRINSAGNVGIGETTPLGKLHVKTGDSGASVSANGDELVIEGSGNAGMTIASGNSSEGTIKFADSGSAAAGYIHYAHNLPGYYIGVEGSDKVVIKQHDFCFGIASPISTNGVTFKVGTTAGDDWISSYRTTASTPHYIHAFYSDAGGTQTAKYAIYADGTASAISDVNYKKNITDARNYLEDLEKIDVIKYNLKTDNEGEFKKLGFSAQQVETIFPNMIDADNTPLKEFYEEGDEIPEGKAIGDIKKTTAREVKLLKKEVFVPMLVKAVQELSAKVKTLETENTDIKARLTELENA